MSGASSSPPAVPAATYAELHCLSNFSFQRGASSAEELFARADALGYAALAITDECSLAGIVRALVAAQGRRTRLIVGCEVRHSCCFRSSSLPRVGQARAPVRRWGLPD